MISINKIKYVFLKNKTIFIDFEPNSKLLLYIKILSLITKYRF